MSTNDPFDDVGGIGDDFEQDQEQSQEVGGSGDPADGPGGGGGDGGDDGGGFTGGGADGPGSNDDDDDPFDVGGVGDDIQRDQEESRQTRPAPEPSPEPGREPTPDTEPPETVDGRESTLLGPEAPGNPTDGPLAIVDDPAGEDGVPATEPGDDPLVPDDRAGVESEFGQLAGPDEGPTDDAVSRLEASLSRRVPGTISTETSNFNIARDDGQFRAELTDQGLEEAGLGDSVGGLATVRRADRDRSATPSPAGSGASLGGIGGRPGFAGGASTAPRGFARVGRSPNDPGLSDEQVADLTEREIRQRVAEQEDVAASRVTVEEADLESGEVQFTLDEPADADLRDPDSNPLTRAIQDQFGIPNERELTRDIQGAVGAPSRQEVVEDINERLASITGGDTPRERVQQGRSGLRELLTENPGRLAAAGAPVAAAEPTPVGEALLLGGLTVGALAEATDADERAREDNPLVQPPEIEAPDELGQETEIDVPTEPTDTAGELETPEGSQSGEIDVPEQPSITGEIATPTPQEQDPFTLRAAEQAQEEREEDEEEDEEEEDEEEEERRETVVDIPPELVPDDPVAIGGGEEPRDTADVVETIIPGEEAAEERDAEQEEDLEPPAERGPFEDILERDRTPVRSGFGEQPALDEGATTPSIGAGVAETLFGDAEPTVGGRGATDSLLGPVAREEEPTETVADTATLPSVESGARASGAVDADVGPDMDALVGQATDTAQLPRQAQRARVTAEAVQTPRQQALSEFFGEPTQTTERTEPVEPTEPTAPGLPTSFSPPRTVRRPRGDEDDEDDEGLLFGARDDERRFATGIFTPGEDNGDFFGEGDTGADLDDLI
jgi:hypothetical protein